MTPQTKFLLRVAMILAIGFALLRFVRMEIDPPFFYSGYSTAEVSDPYIYTSFARNKALFDDWDPNNYERWKSWRISLLSGAAYLVYLVDDVSRSSTALTGVILQLLGVGLFAYGLARRRTSLETTVTLFLLMTASMFFFWSRSPVLESAVVLWSGLLVLLYFRYDHKPLTLMLVGAGIAWAMFTGKLTAIVLFAPLIVDLYIFTRARWANIGFVIGGYAVGAVIYTALFYDFSFTELLLHYDSLTAGVGLAAVIPTSLRDTVAVIFYYGVESGLTRFHPMLFTMSGIAAISLTHQFALISRSKDVDAMARLRLPIFFAVWVIVGIVTTMPYPYRPSRYFYPLFLPMCALVGWWIATLISGETNKRKFISAWSFAPYVVAFLTGGWIAALWGQFLRDDVTLESVTPVEVITWLPLVAGTASCFLTFLLRTGKARLSPRLISTLALGSLLVVFARQSQVTLTGLVRPVDGIQRQSAELEDLINSNQALLTGNWAPAFAVETHARTLIHPFSSPFYESDLFEKFPVTHIVTLPGEFDAAKQRYPEIVGKAQPMVQIWTRDGAFMIYSVTSPNYQPTDFEKGMMALYSKYVDSALYYFERFKAYHPKNFHNRWRRATALTNLSRFDESARELQQLSEENRHRFYAHILIGQEYTSLYRLSGRPAFARLANEEFALAEEQNPYVRVPAQYRP